MNVNVVAIIGARMTRTINSVNLLPVLVLVWLDGAAEKTSFLLIDTRHA